MLKETYIALRSILTGFCRQPFVVKCVSVKTYAQDRSISQVLDWVDNKSTSEAPTPLSLSLSLEAIVDKWTSTQNLTNPRVLKETPA